MGLAPNPLTDVLPICSIDIAISLIISFKSFFSSLKDKAQSDVYFSMTIYLSICMSPYFFLEYNTHLKYIKRV